MLKQSNLEDYIVNDGQICPYCQSENITYLTNDVILCEKCKKKWKNIYSLEIVDVETVK